MCVLSGFRRTLAGIALFSALAAGSGPVIADHSNPVLIPANIATRVVLETSVVVASYQVNGPEIELSITIRVADGDPMHSRIVLIDGQKFSITAPGTGDDAPVLRYDFRRIGPAIELTLPPAPAETTHPQAGNARRSDGGRAAI